MPPQLNAAQMAIIEDMWSVRDIFPKGRIDKRMVRSVTMDCWTVGPGLAEGVSEQFIGRLYANRYAAEENRPRALQKTPEQLEMLRQLWERDAYPTTGETILVSYDSGLTKEQIKNWFENERRTTLLPSSGNQAVRANAAKMWRAFKRDPDGFAEALRSGTVSKLTGERLR